MFIDTIINFHLSKSTFIDLGATHNFISDQKTRRMIFKVEMGSSKMKAINSEALPIVGVLKIVSLKLRAWLREMDLVVVYMDNFEVELGMDFLLEC